MVCSDITYLCTQVLSSILQLLFIFEKTSNTFPPGLNHEDESKEQLIDGKMLIFCSMEQINLDQTIVVKLKLNLASTAAYVV